MIKPMEGKPARFRDISFARRHLLPADPGLAAINLDAHRTDDPDVEPGVVHPGAQMPPSPPKAACTTRIPIPAEEFADQLQSF